MLNFSGLFWVHLLEPELECSMNIPILVGTGIGMFIEQNYTDIPDVKKTISELIEEIKTAANSKK